ncbi:MAG: hypothetical protein AB1656_25850 [Candidatus Omnitrophota bacterium]
MSPTFDLFAIPSFLEGIGSVIDLGGNFHYYNENRTPEEADMKALLSDWNAIGIEFNKAFQTLQKEAMD